MRFPVFSLFILSSSFLSSEENFAPAEDVYPTRNQATRFQTLPRQDPVVYQDWVPTAPISEEQFNSYRDDGFLILMDLFTPSEVAELLQESSRLMELNATFEPETVVFEPNSTEIRSIFLIVDRSLVIKKAAEKIGKIVEFLLADPVYVLQSRLNYKLGISGATFPWHSDFETWHSEDGMSRMRALSASIFLTENTPHNGPLLLVPGSHKQFISCPGVTPSDNFKWSLRNQIYGTPSREILREMVAENGLEAAIGPSGTTVLFDCNTMHGSNSNITPWPRSNAFFIFNAISNVVGAPYGGAPPRPYFLANRDQAPQTLHTNQ